MIAVPALSAGLSLMVAMTASLMNPLLLTKTRSTTAEERKNLGALAFVVSKHFSSGADFSKDTTDKKGRNRIRIIVRSEIKDKNIHEKEKKIKSYRDETIRWFERFIIGMEICPFAMKPHKKKQIKVQILLGQDKTWIQSQILKEMTRLKLSVLEKEASNDENVKDQDPKSKDVSVSMASSTINDDVTAKTTTTLIVTPDLHPNDFLQYLNFVRDEVGEFVNKNDETMEDYVQLVTFHPRYQFDGSSMDGIDNYTNRSPYPMIHLLREIDVTNAVESMPNEDASIVWQRNVDVLEAIRKHILMPLLKRSSNGTKTNKDIEETKVMLYDKLFLNADSGEPTDRTTCKEKQDTDLRSILQQYKPSNYWNSLDNDSVPLT